MTKSLTEIANDLRIDKGTLQELQGHGYTIIYEQLFKPLLDGREVSLMEIGVYDPRFPGGSVELWKSYFPDLYFVGMDINPDARVLDERNIHIFIGDQNSKTDLVECMYQHGVLFDVIIDDGSHVGEHILTSFSMLFPYVKPGGYYIIEDLHSIYTDFNLTFAKLKQLIEKYRFLIKDMTLCCNNKLLVMRKAL